MLPLILEAPVSRESQRRRARFGVTAFPFVILYWGVWLAFTFLALYSEHATIYRWWLISPYVWWVTPFVLLLLPPPHSNETAPSILAMIVLAAVLWKFHEFLQDSLEGWYAFGRGTWWAVLQFPARTFLVGLIISIAVSRPLLICFGRSAAIAALILGVAVFAMHAGEALVSMERWQARPLGNLIRLLEATLLPLLMAAGAERQSWNFADRNKADKPAQYPSVGARPRRWGFVSSLALSVVLLVALGAACGAATDSAESIAYAGLVIGWGAIAAFITSAARISWKRAANPPGPPRILTRGGVFFARVSVVVGALIIWFPMLWWVAPGAGHQIQDFATRVPGPAWDIRISRNGKVMYFSGPIDAEAAAAFRDAIDSSPELGFVDLNSPGGEMQAGDQIAKQIKLRHLVTVVREECASACTDVFLAGRVRWLQEGATLGFHRPTNDGLPVDTEVSELTRAYRRQGVAEKFAVHAAQVPHWDMWYPSDEELIEAGVVTEVLTESDCNSRLAELSLARSRGKS